MKLFKKYFINNFDKFFLVLATILIVFIIHHYYKAGIIVAINDAATRINISRKIFDNLTPGLGQLGNVWPPLPQLLMLPFVYSTFLWRTGLAGSIVSGLSFLITTYFSLKLCSLITKNVLTKTIVILYLFTNINLLYLSTTPMSESLFIATITCATYFLFKWGKFRKDIDLIIGAVAVSASTATRFEGIFMLLFSILFIFYVSVVKEKKYKYIEGKIILFSSMAFTGLASWSLYLWLIFGNPLYWLLVYSHKISIISSDVTSRRVLEGATTFIPEKGNILLSLYSYWKSAAFMNGILTTVIVTCITLFFLIVLIKNKKYEKNPELLALLLPASIFIFITLTLFKGGVPIFQPELNLENIINFNTNLFQEVNIRYGILIAPFFVTMLSWATSKNKVILYVCGISIIVQTFFTYNEKLFLVYNLTKKIEKYGGGISEDQSAAADWLRTAYDGGFILISDLQHSPVIFRLNQNLKQIIHEGTGRYWIESRDNPQKYARYIFMYKYTENAGTDEDPVTRYVSQNPELEKNFSMVYENDKIQIYKIKTKPDIVIE